MQSIEPAASLTAVSGANAAALVPARARAAESPAKVVRETSKTADVTAFGGETYAVFSVDKETHATRIAIYDGEGRLMRMIPPRSVADMLSQLAAYRRLR